ncbi:MAG: tRNA lysidine(34) synthetase TilS [Sphingobacteriaceae bacterium]|nr:tRNA lysidine(34) synthetase TilS [Sphingobacteriaceae bacterium]
MEQAVFQYIKAQKLFKEKDEILLALSGGVDSVVLVKILSQKYKVTVAHCNFMLRGKESDADETFCKGMASKLGVQFLSKKLNAAAYATKNGLSIQMAARELRYNWFKEILQKKKLDYLVTAHHHDDNIETFFLNLFKGSGTKGLKGMQSLESTSIKPLLPFTKDQIINYAKINKLKFREDSSNTKTLYERNFIRLELVPLIQKKFPMFEEVMKKNFRNLREEHTIINSVLDKATEKHVFIKKDVVYVALSFFKKCKYKNSFLNYLLTPYQFNSTQIDQIIACLTSKSSVGKKFLSKEFVLTVEREFLTIVNHKIKKENLMLKDLKEIQHVKFLEFSFVKKFEKVLKNELIIHKNDLVFPLTIRTRKTGDKFKPFGMKGFKLLSDFFKDEKVSNAQRDKVKLLVNNNGDIIWVMGLRSDERYRVNSKEKDLIKLKYLE